MEICVVGTGVIGTIYGAVLAESGSAVTHLVRPGGASRLDHGVEVELLDARLGQVRERRIAYQPQTVDHLEPGRFELVLASVHHNQVADLLPTLAAAGGDVALFNNWWDTFAPVEAHLAGRYTWAFPVAGGGFDGRRLHAALLDHVVVSGDQRQAGACSERVAQLFTGSDLSVERPPDMLTWLWVHFATEAGIIAAAIKTGDVAAFLDNIDALTEGVLGVRDALAVVAARGVDPWQRPEAQMFLADAGEVAAGIRTIYQVDRAARLIMERHTGGDDLSRIYRDVTATGRELGVAMPVLAALGQYVEAYAAAS